jgi:hypothetical protein
MNYCAFNDDLVFVSGDRGACVFYLEFNVYLMCFPNIPRSTRDFGDFIMFLNSFPGLPEMGRFTRKACRGGGSCRKCRRMQKQAAGTAVYVIKAQATGLLPYMVCPKISQYTLRYVAQVYRETLSL